MNQRAAFLHLPLRQAGEGREEGHGPGDITLVLRRADTFFSRLTGLLFSPPLPPGHGLLIVPCAAVHTAFMRFAIDVVFLDRVGRIKKIVPHLKPWRATACAEAWQTLELAAGEAQRMGLTLGVSLAPNLNAFNQEAPA